MTSLPDVSLNTSTTASTEALPRTCDPGALKRRFDQLFGSEADTKNSDGPIAFHAPGRVNLIGEHTDYTGGMVFPCAIDRGTVLLVRRNHLSRFRFASTNFDETADLSLHEVGQLRPGSWTNYPRGVVDQFRQRGIDVDGLDCLYSGNVPNGAGLSSSASIEVVTAFAINELFNAGLSRLELVKLSQLAENEFVGTQSGILDQFAVTMGRADHAVQLNCQTLEHRYVPLNLPEHAIVLANTNQRRELNQSAYNDRVDECRRALTLLQQKLPLQSLGDLSVHELDRAHDLFVDDETALKRARHICTENDRVRRAVETLENDDLKTFGDIMVQSHVSLRDDFEVSSQPLDTLVSLAMEHDGVLGARLTGAGFGGCTVNLMHQQSVASFQRHVGLEYQKNTGMRADFYVIRPASGVGTGTGDTVDANETSQ